MDDVIRHTTRGLIFFLFKYSAFTELTAYPIVIRSGIQTTGMTMCLAYRCRAYDLLGDIRKSLADVEAFRVFDPLVSCARLTQISIGYCWCCFQNKDFIEKHIELQDRLKVLCFHFTIFLPQ